APSPAARIFRAGEAFTADKLQAQAVVDGLAEDGDGVRAVGDYMHRHERRHGAHVAIYKARNVVNAVTLDEMLNIASIWVDAALRLEEADLRRMERLVARSEERRVGKERGASWAQGETVQD